ncbi:NADH:flavin oxidoreductase/NADH oxidase [Halosegnis longus]|uniref:NADH:flavin oxidoreductase/NADH oxidase n=1 Tax=Halosegnis longus TaxID=2216012 RepID=A0AAJ4R7K9_9EURY|nr:NADH:flavin oxidoreductase/NADH oxidase [Halosegnis longus]RNJ25918.1 NADH:flavin oxidoreductase/NADH oxidase [Salella cibi]
MPHLFDELELRDTTLRNRIAVSPMCQYSCDDMDGLATDWHKVHLGSRATGGAGLIISEATAVEPRGRISPQDLGIWSAEHADALADTTAFIKKHGAVPAIQLAHAGRKASTYRPGDRDDRTTVADEDGWTPVGPTEEPYPYEQPLDTHKLTTEEVEEVVESFREGAEHALDAGFEAAEVHAAHGYLLHEFYSPLTNTRDDKYGGDFEGRTRLVREVTRAVREVWPDDKPVFVRLSATDWMGDENWTVEDTARLAPLLAADGADMLDISGGANHPDQEIPHTGPHYQVPYAETVREALDDTDCTVGAVGAINTAEGADALVRNERADLVLQARQSLYDPNFPLHAAEELGVEPPVPRQYYRGF